MKALGYGLPGTGLPCIDERVQVVGLTHLVSIAAGLWNGYALTSSGVACPWGINDDGELGDGQVEATQRSSDKPTRVGGRHMSATAATWISAYGSTKSGAIFGWGRYDRTSQNFLKPSPMPRPTRALGLGAGGGGDLYVLVKP
jgi:hypothetical protein